MGTERPGELDDARPRHEWSGPRRARARDPAADPWRWGLVAVLTIAGLADYVALNVAVLPRCIDLREPEVAAAAPRPLAPPRRPAVASLVEPAAAAEPSRALAPRPEPGAAPATVQATADEAAAGSLFPIGDLHFVTNSSALLGDGVAAMEVVARALSRTSGKRVLLRGHADERGDTGANQRLSERRAAAVASYLRRRGISLDRIEIEGVGERMPADASGTPEARARNRRVEVLWR